MEENPVHSETPRSVMLGISAAFLYGTAIFAPFFSAPLQIAWSKGGLRSFLLSTSIALIGIAGWMLWQFKSVGSLGLVNLLLILSTPAGLAVSIAWINSPRFASWPLVYRALTGGLLVAAITIPSVLTFYNNKEIETYLKNGMEEMAKAIGTASGEGYDAAVIKSSLDPDVLLEAARRGIADSFAAIVFIFAFLGHWLGAHMVDRASPPETRGAPTLGGFSVPNNLIWAFLGVWAGVLVTRIPAVQALGVFRVLEAVAWNAALMVSFCYALQGMAILRHLLGRLAPTGPLVWVGTLLVVLLLLNSVSGVWTAGILAVLGATETWVPYRIDKGVQI